MKPGEKRSPENNFSGYLSARDFGVSEGPGTREGCPWGLGPALAELPLYNNIVGLIVCVKGKYALFEA